MKKKYYCTPVIEEIFILPDDVVLDGSGNASRGDYGAAQEFDW